MIFYSNSEFFDYRAMMLGNSSRKTAKISIVIFSLFWSCASLPKSKDIQLKTTHTIEYLEHLESQNLDRLENDHFEF